MAVTYFNGSGEDEQARGGDLDAGKMEMYALRRDDPKNMIYMGGHFFDDAPTYNITDGKVLPIRKHVNGQNIVEEEQVSQDVVKSVTFNLLLPSKSLSVTDRLYQQQKTSQYDVVFVPDTCDNSCDTFFFLAKKVRFGAKQMTSTILGYDDNAQPITNMRSLRATGNLITYYGLDGNTKDSPDSLLSAVLIEEKCENSDCPYQKIVVGADGDILHSEDGGNTYTAYTTTAIAAAVTAPKFTGVAYSGGNIVFAFVDNVAVPTDAGLGYINYATGSAGALATLDGVTTGIASTLFIGVIEALGKVYAFGDDVIAVSCDGGVSYTTVASTSVLAGAVLRKAVYDPGTGNIIFIGDNLAMFAYDGSTVSDYSGTSYFPTLAGTVDFTAIAVGKPGHVYLGTNAGSIFEISDFGSFSTSNFFTLISDDPSATAVVFIGADKNDVRVVWAETGTNVIKSRDVTNKMIPYIVYATPTLVSGVTGKNLLDEGTNYFYIFGATDVVTLASCGLCLNSGC